MRRGYTPPTAIDLDRQPHDLADFTVRIQLRHDVADEVAAPMASVANEVGADFLLDIADGLADLVAATGKVDRELVSIRLGPKISIEAAAIRRTARLS